jgi:hypothetical protein
VPLEVLHLPVYFELDLLVVEAQIILDLLGFGEGLRVVPGEILDDCAVLP